MTMAVAPTVEAVVRAGGEHIPPLMDALEQRLAEQAAGHGEVLARHGGDTIAAGGKRLRPLIVFVMGGPPVASAQEGLVAAAVAVELVHSATLVHDDVLDAAALRRGRPTVVAAGGREIATASGDLLFARAFSVLAGTGNAAAVRVLSAASTALAQGELLQRADAFRADVAVERYLLRCELKTARLFAAACELGALQATASSAAQQAVFGRRIGLAFQLLDDVLDVSGSAERTGKTRGADLLDGTVTLPLILARERDPQLAALDPRSVSSAARAAEVCDRIEATGVLSDVRRRALDEVSAAKRGLPALPPEQRRALELIADGVVERYT